MAEKAQINYVLLPSLVKVLVRVKTEVGLVSKTGFVHILVKSVSHNRSLGIVHYRGIFLANF